ncbi:MAG: hypothetical protein EA397_14050 [Deltaproteobacteria bacterium]|nr:MAG: hypothetical protein EA397_14050 [Deltaproteobacteria bacterium]
MSDTCHGLIVLMSALPSAQRAELSTEQLVREAGGERLDETEHSLTLAFESADAQGRAVEALVQRGLVEGEHLFAVQVGVPTWLPAFRDASSAMVEHGG